MSAPILSKADARTLTDRIAARFRQGGMGAAGVRCASFAECCERLAQGGDRHSATGATLDRGGFLVTLTPSPDHPGYINPSLAMVDARQRIDTTRPMNLDGIGMWVEQVLSVEAGMTPDALSWRVSVATSAPSESDHGGVYFIADEDGYVKIGYSKTPGSRIDTLQTASRQRLTLLATVPGTPADERALHKRFKESRVRGEWFRPTPELLDLIGVHA